MARFEFDIARRLSFSSEGKRTPAVGVATAAVALSVAIMLVAVAVVFGFKEEITRKLVGFNSHVTLYPAQAPGSSSVFSYEDKALDSILSHENFITSYTPSVSAPAILKQSDAFLGGFLLSLGVNDSSFLASNLEEGRVPVMYGKAPGNDILISRRAADALRLSTGDSINTYFLSQDVAARRLRVAGIYNSHLEDFDSRFFFAPLATIQSLTGLQPDQATMLKASVSDMQRLPQYAPKLQADLDRAFMRGEIGRSFTVDTVYRQGANFFTWLDLIDTNVWVILILMTIVSAFSLIAAMLIIILEKVRFIGVMRSLGARAASMRRVFVWLSLRVGLRGMAWGTAIGLGLAALQAWLHIVPLNPEGYYMDFVPIHFNLWWILGIEIGFALIIYLVLALPSFFVSRISPAESMRFDS